jgi:hypothetical protein
MDEDKPYDAGEPKDVKERIKEAQRWDTKRDRVILGVMSTEDGRRWVREFLEHCMVGHNPYNPEPVKMAFNCGGLNAGQVFMSQIMNASPELYMQMMAEANPTAQEQKDENNG